MRTRVIITTYNRPDSFKRVARALRAADVDIVAYNDGSDVPYPDLDFVTMRRLNHHGREGYRQVVARAFREAMGTAWDRLLMVPDDAIPVPWALERAERAWQSITDPAKGVLGVLVDRRGHIQQWGSHVPVPVGPDVMLTGWNDLAFYSDERVRELLPRGFRPPSEHVKGSGVGAQWSQHLREVGRNVYCVRRTLFDHLPGPSVMCPEERLLHPL